LRLEGLEKVEGIAKSALMLEDAIPNLMITGLGLFGSSYIQYLNTFLSADYDHALAKFNEEEELLKNDRVLLDAKGRLWL
jgi:hypothetical protein